MRHLSHCMTRFVVLLAGFFFISQLQAEELDSTQIRDTLVRSVNWYLEHPNDTVALRWWQMAPYYDGLLAVSEITGNASYLSAVIAMGEQVGWTLGDRVYHADDHAVGHAWLAIYGMDQTRLDRLASVQSRMDYVLSHPIREVLRFGESPFPHVTDRWSWCDALYMAPPTLAMLSKITGDEKYLRFMDYEYRATYDELWDAEEKLFYRDSRFPGKLTAQGKKIFWSRGNGWVYGGLPMILDVLSAHDISKPFYEQLFLEMTESIVACQQADGLWRPNLHDSEQVPTGESSGTGFFLYGLAWGVNHGYLDRETYWPIIVKGWNALMTCIQPDGWIGYVQPVGFDPRNNVEEASTHVYGAGALWLAGSEILKLTGFTAAKPALEIYREAEELVREGKLQKQVSAHVIPRRLDDVAWENDRIAFRVYGPALRDSAEDSGIDVWSKRVSSPIIAKWYEGSFSGEINYHEDTGEGYDGYSVGAARGCGGTAIVYQDKLYTANTYMRSSVKYTSGDYAELVLEYRYEIEDASVVEVKTIRLHKGSQLCEASSHFKGSKKILDSMKVVVGLTAQTSEPLVQRNGVTMTLWEKVNGYSLGTAVHLDNGFEQDSITGWDDPIYKNDSFILVRLLKGNRLDYKFGYAWERFSDFQDPESWHDFVKQQ